MRKMTGIFSKALGVAANTLPIPLLYRAPPVTTISLSALVVFHAVYGEAYKLSKG
ncbi:hypothetical protein [Sphingomonas sp. TDK1]|uniref:hypothetical protein n=1 Tax=Sphingomonas sp. TDK1 TaxID=453247 RepID=UPI000B037B2C|nr:hypothetical protein [Sphingomonas sp. TDK1]